MVRRRRRDGDEIASDPEKDEFFFDPLGPFFWISSGWSEDEVWEVFDDEDECRAYWDEHRERLIQEYALERPGKRPWAFWQWEAPRPPPILPEDRPEGAPDDLQNGAAVLLEMGELGEDERARCPGPTPCECATWGIRYREHVPNPEPEDDDV